MPPVNSATPAALPSVAPFSADIIKLLQSPEDTAQSPVSSKMRGKTNDAQLKRSFMRYSWDVYSGVLNPYLKQPGARDKGDSGDGEGVLPINHFPSWLQKWSVLYADEPARRFYYDGKAIAPESAQYEASEAISGWYRSANINGVLGRVDMLMRALGNVVLVPFFDAAEQDLVIHEYNGYRIRVVENSNNPAKPYVTVLCGTAIDVDGKRIEIGRAYGATWYADINSGNVSAPNEIGFNPLVHCFDQDPTNESGYFVDAPGPVLADIAMRLINDGYSDINYTSLMQGAGLLQIFGTVSENLAIGPGRAIRFSGDTDRREGAEYASPNAPLTERMEVLSKMLDDVRATFGIPSSMIDAKTDASGAAIVQANAPLAEIRKARSVVFRGIETRLLRSIIRVMQSNGMLQDAGDAALWDVGVTYEKPQASASTQDRIAQEKHDLEIGVLKPAEILMQRRPDEFDSVEEAEAYLRDATDASESKTADQQDVDNSNEET